MPGIRKSLVFSQSSKFLYDHIIDIHVNTEVLTTGLVIPSGTKTSKLLLKKDTGVN